MLQTFDIIIAIVAMVFTGSAMYFDLKFRRIPNGLTVSVFAAGLVFQVGTLGWAGLSVALGGFAAGFLPLLVLWLIGGGGGGDVKMMGALGAWLGAPVTLIVFFGSAVVALLMMVGVMAWRAVAQPVGSTAGGGDVTSGKLEHAQRLIPYAVPVTVMTWGWMLTRLVVTLLA